MYAKAELEAKNKFGNRELEANGNDDPSRKPVLNVDVLKINTFDLNKQIMAHVPTSTLIELLKACSADEDTLNCALYTKREISFIRELLSMGARPNLYTPFLLHPDLIPNQVVELVESLVEELLETKVLVKAPFSNIDYHQAGNMLLEKYLPLAPKPLSQATLLGNSMRAVTSPTSSSNSTSSTSSTSVNKMLDKWGKGPLHAAVTGGHKESVELAISMYTNKKVGDLNQKSFQSGSTAIMYAVVFTSLEVFILLLDNPGIDLSIKNVKHETVLDFASRLLQEAQVGKKTITDPEFLAENNGKGPNGIIPELDIKKLENIVDALQKKAAQHPAQDVFIMK